MQLIVNSVPSVSYNLTIRQQTSSVMLLIQVALIGGCVATAGVRLSSLRTESTLLLCLLRCFLHPLYSAAYRLSPCILEYLHCSLR